MIYLISILNIIVPIIISSISYKIDGRGQLGLSILSLGLLYFYLINKEVRIPLFYDSILIKTSSIIGGMIFILFGFWSMYIIRKSK